MNQEINYPKHLQGNINNTNLFIKIWTKPTETLIYIFKNCPEKHLMFLFALGGIVKSLERSSSKSENELISIAHIGISVLFGGLLGWLTYYFYAWILNISGEWLNGKAQPKQFRTVIAWSLIPTICSIIVLFPEVIIYKSDLFESSTIVDTHLSSSLITLFLIAKIILAIWSFFILVKGVSLIQGFSISKSILNLILPVALIAIPILLFLFLFNLLE